MLRNFLIELPRKILLQRDKFQHHTTNKTQTPNTNTNDPPHRIESPFNHSNSTPQKSDKNGLKNDYHDDNDDKILRPPDSFENIQTIVKHSAIEKVENLQKHKNVEIVRVVHRILVIPVFFIVTGFFPPRNDKVSASNLSPSDGVY